MSLKALIKERLQYRSEQFEDNVLKFVFSEMPLERIRMRTFPLRSNSKAAYLAVRREKELGINNYEGSYKLTMSPSGETIDPRSSPEKTPLEMVKMKQASNENLVLDNRLPLEPPDLIPKMPTLNRKSTSVQDVYETSKDLDCNRGSYERYRHLPNSFNFRSNSRIMYGGDIRRITEDENNADHCRNIISSAKSESELRERLSQGLTKDAVHQSIDTAVNRPVSSTSINSDVVSGSESVSPELELTSLDSVAVIEVSAETTNSNLTEEKPHLPDCAVERSRSLVERPTNYSRTDISSSIERSTSFGEDPNIPDVTQQRLRVRKLVERSTSFGRGDSMLEVSPTPILDVSVSLSDAASQTDLTEEPIDPDDLEVERLSRDLASQLSPSDKLQSLLVPAADRKKPTDYVAGLFNLDALPRRRNQRKHKTGSTCSNSSGTSTSSTASSSSASSVDAAPKITNDLVKPEPLSPLPSTSPYFTTSESKAKLLTRISDGVESLSPVQDTAELQHKKEELMQRLDRKLAVLRAEQLSLSEECGLNEELGTAVANQVARVARPHEASKYRLHVEEVGKITSLLLGLSGRLARAENALIGLPENHAERKIHEEKRDKLKDQLMEAKVLKESIDRRSESVCKTLGKYLSEEDLADYLHFIHMKEKLIVDAREVSDKIALGEEQLVALREPHGIWP